MTTAATITANLVLDSDKFQRGVEKATKASESFAKKWDDIGNRMVKIGAGMTLALTVPIVGFLKSAVASAAEAEAALADVEAVIKSTGGVAGVTVEQVTKYANAMQLVTKFGDEAIMQGQSMLLTFTNIGQDVFPRASDAMLDMAQKFGTDLPQAAIQLGKALNDPIEGVSALRRIGVSLTQEQEDQIKSFMAVNDIASAQGIILDELEKEVGGVAEAFGSTFAGKMAIFNNRLDDFKETLGMAIIPSLIRFMDALTPILDALADAPPWVVDFIVSIMGIAALAGPLITVGGIVAKVFYFFSPAGGGGAAIAWISNTLIPGIASVGTAIWGALLPILPIVLAIIAIVAGVAFVIWAFATDFMGVTTTLKQLFWIIGYEFKKLGAEIKQAWSDAMDWLDKETKKSADTWKNNFQQAQEIQTKLFQIGVETMLKWWNDFSAKVMGKIAEVRNWFINAWNTAAGVFYSIFTSISNFFNSVIVGIINGINALIGAINSLGFALESLEIPEELTPGSPTPFELGLRGISKAMDTLARSTVPELNASFAPSGVSNVGTGKTINIVDNRRFASGMDAKTLRTALDDRFANLTEALEEI